jgi:hypothetical protein
VDPQAIDRRRLVQNVVGLDHQQVAAIDRARVVGLAPERDEAEVVAAEARDGRDGERGGLGVVPGAAEVIGEGRVGARERGVLCARNVVPVGEGDDGGRVVDVVQAPHGVLPVMVVT